MSCADGNPQRTGQARPGPLSVEGAEGLALEAAEADPDIELRPYSASESSPELPRLAGKDSRESFGDHYFVNV